jgi:3-dehydroquinate synthase
VTDTTLPEGTTEIRVGGPDGYVVAVGTGLLGSLPALLGPRVAKVLIVHAPTLGARAEELRAGLVEAGFEALIAEVPDAEAAKRIEVAAFCWQILGQSDFTRTDAVVGLGGGAVTDLAGFVAATWLRGVPYFSVPTSVLGMVDASVGGKTGINTNEGKNLVGTFSAPRAVVVDLDLVHTLPRNDVLTGFAEIVKAGFIAVPEILDIVEADVDRATDPSTPEFRRVVELAIGMVFAAELARLTGHLDDATVDRHRSILESLSLPTSYPLGRWQSLLATMRRDKKARAGMLRFIVLDGVGKPVTLEGPEDHLLFTAYQEVGV